ncbi:MAG: dTDP-4-dehydrorhamnose 3,5-epimerase family protein [Candidatus Auribacterota bacterium]|jgi:dTDP-4-dehydrorhamnose 3,5-epimerase|uniref:dTDP-4-dehydrorhamnose 3,5-epimerase n=1 Tax=Candidatus Auribacter fodinae TaxID=2093366 RepID=A0A3A4R744_9BACT|nr:MAG: dTDP-4-dehydrorhamnose 3,5-epimerase [Candidatus Auribacter fodinae]
MAKQLIHGVQVKQLRPIPDERGRLMEILRRDDPIYEGFGQVYVTTTNPGVVKAWHFHKKQVDHFVCLKGMAKVVLYDSRDDSPTKGMINEFFMGDYNPILVKIPDFVYHGFKCISESECMILNCTTNTYNYEDPDEYRLDPHDNDIPYDWSLKEG